MSRLIAVRALSRGHAAWASGDCSGAIADRAERTPRRRRRRHLGACVGVVLAIGLTQGPQAQEPAGSGNRDGADRVAWRSLFDGQTTAGWEAARGYVYDDDAVVTVREGCLHLGAGQPATGIRWTRSFPRTNYELECEAQRVDGSDFFCGVSFPVGDGALTLILGGWGGGVVGLSSLDGQRAIDNETCSSREFVNGRWYRVRLRVTPQKVAAYLDGQFLCGVDLGGHALSVTSEMEPCLPLGFATWNTTGRLRGIRYRTLVD